MEVNPKQMKSKDQVESKKKKKNKEKKEKHENLMKEQPASPFSCAAHPADFLRVMNRPVKSPPTCKSCGFKLEGKAGYLCCAKSNSCFQLCSNCRVCTANHVLRSVISLKKQDNELYKENRFNCHGCKAVKEVSEQLPAWHCHPCQFTICTDCQLRYDALWLGEPEKEEEEQ